MKTFLKVLAILGAVVAGAVLVVVVWQNGPDEQKRLKIQEQGERLIRLKDSMNERNRNRNPGSSVGR